MGPGIWEILIIFLVIIIFFGAKKIPELAQSLGRGLQEFKKATRDINDEVKSASDDMEADFEKDSKR